MILGLDPGPEQSALVGWDGTRVCFGHMYALADLRVALTANSAHDTTLAIEGISPYGTAIGRSTIQTCYVIGRACETWYRLTGDEPTIIERPDIKLRLLGQRKGTDAQVREELIHRIGPVGTKKAPGPLYGISSHLWAALAVAVACEA